MYTCINYVYGVGLGVLFGVCRGVGMHACIGADLMGEEGTIYYYHL